MAALLIVLSCILFLGANGQRYDNLYQNILRNGPPPTIPMYNSSTPVEVEFGMSLIEVLELNMDKMYIDTLVWAQLRWTDGRFAWDPVIYDADSIIVSQRLLWTPDIVLYNGQDVKKIEEVNAVLMSNGQIITVNPFRIRTSCRRASVSGDTVECKMKFGSWVYDSFKLDLELPLAQRSGSPDLTSYVANPKWELVDSAVVRDVNKYDCCPEIYVAITYKFIFRSGSSGGSMGTPTGVRLA